MKALQKGIMTKAGRSDIISSVYTLMLQHQPNPTPYVYRTACKRLIQKFPELTDNTASGFVSTDILVTIYTVRTLIIQPLNILQGTWKEQLKQKFRNGRRDMNSGNESHTPVSPTSDSTSDKRKKSRLGTVGMKVLIYTDCNCLCTLYVCISN